MIQDGKTDARARQSPADADGQDIVIEVRDLVKRFGEHAAVDHLSFAVRRGEIFGLLGPNGSGKTTTINMISGLSAATAGRVRVLGRDPRRNARAVRRQLGVVPQETALYEELSAERNLAFHAQLYGVPRAEQRGRVEAMLELAQLTSVAKQRVGSFSGGMQRRLAIARAMLHEPELVYLDEPTLGVDVQARFVIWDYIREMKSAGRTVLLTTNYLEESDQLCDRIAVIDHGRLIAMDTPARLKARFGSATLELEFADPPAPGLVSSLAALPGIRETSGEGRSLQLILADDSAAGANGSSGIPKVLALAGEAGAEVTGVSMREPSLDEAFLALTGKGIRD